MNLTTEGSGRTEVSLSVQQVGNGLIVCLFNKNQHIGAVALADYDLQEKRASTSVITRLGHKEDAIARNAAYRLCKKLQGPVCAIAGIHLDNITKEEIEQIEINCNALIERLLRITDEKSLKLGVGSF